MVSASPLKSLLTAREIAEIDAVAAKLAGMSAQLSRITGFDPGEDKREASLLLTIKELMEALEGLTGYSPPLGENYSKANAALSRAKSLMEQKP